MSCFSRKRRTAKSTFSLYFSLLFVATNDGITIAKLYTSKIFQSSLRMNSKASCTTGSDSGTPLDSRVSNAILVVGMGPSPKSHDLLFFLITGSPIIVAWQITQIGEYGEFSVSHCGHIRMCLPRCARTQESPFFIAALIWD